MKVKLLKKLRRQAEYNLKFIGRWSGYWLTNIEGIYFYSNVVSGFKFVTLDCGYFLQNAISLYVSMKRKKEYEKKVFVTTFYVKDEKQKNKIMMLDRIDKIFHE